MSLNKKIHKEGHVKNSGDKNSRKKDQRRKKKLRTI